LHWFEACSIEIPLTYGAMFSTCGPKECAHRETVKAKFLVSTEDFAEHNDLKLQKHIESRQFV
jgi:hypothetical protein